MKGMYNLIGGINRKKEDAFKTFFIEHFASAVMFANRYVNHLETAADIAQEGFVRLWLWQGTFTSLEGVKSFLYKTVRNLALDYIKHMEVENKYLRRNGGKEQENLSADIIEEEIYRILHRVVDSLPPQSRRVMLYTIEGNSNREIADKMGVSINTVRTLKQNSHRKMKAILRDHY